MEVRDVACRALGLMCWQVLLRLLVVLDKLDVKLLVTRPWVAIIEISRPVSGSVDLDRSWP